MFKPQEKMCMRGERPLLIHGQEKKRPSKVNDFALSSSLFVDLLKIDFLKPSTGLQQTDLCKR